MSEPHHMKKASVIGAPINVVDLSTAIATISAWAGRHESRYVCICNAHSCVTARRDAAFSEVIREADMATPDGAPVAWMLRRLGYAAQDRISGPDLMLRYCALAATTGEPIFLFGATAEVLEALARRLVEDNPGLRIGGALAPPFGAMTPAEDAAVVAQINSSGAGTVWVGLGCPRQEKWMAAHRGKINAVMIGVGAAFDFHAGFKARAPLWMQRHGLEWLHRLASEPRRLAKRYVVTNTLFIVAAVRQLLQG